MGFAIDALLIDPTGDIRRARDMENWFSGLALSVSYFEYFGANAIRAYLNYPELKLRGFTRLRRRTR